MYLESHVRVMGGLLNLRLTEVEVVLRKQYVRSQADG